MAINENLTNRVAALLENVAHVKQAKMFGGVAFMVDGKMCVTVNNDRIMCRIDPSLQDELVERPGCSAMIMKGKELQGYITVDEAVLSTKKQLTYWVKLALDYNPFAKVTAKKKTVAKKK